MYLNSPMHCLISYWILLKFSGFSPVFSLGYVCLFVFQGFMTYLVEPLFGEWARFSNTRLSQTMLGHLGLNKASWKGVQREQSSSGDDVDPAFEEMDSDILPQEPRLS